MSDTDKKIAYALDTEARITRELLNAQPTANSSITIHFHDGWLKRYETTITGKPENPQEGNS